jgi:hypothetical protein
MKTTELFVDITLVGFLSLIWICGFLFSFVFDPKIIKIIFLEASPSSVVLILLIVYSLGIIFDYLNALIFSFFKTEEEKKLYKDFSIAKVVVQNDKVYPFVENYYGRLRIMRSIIISIPLITWSLSCFVYCQVSKIKSSLSLVLLLIILFGLLFFILCIFSYKSRNKDYKKYIADLKSIYLKPDGITKEDT